MASDRSPQPYKATADHLASHGWCVNMLSGGHEMMLTNTEVVAAVVHAAVAVPNQTA